MKRKKLIVLGLVAVMGVSLVACGGSGTTEQKSEIGTETAQEQTSETVTEAAEKVNIVAVTEIQIGGNTALVCYPENNVADTSKVTTTCTAPVFFVFGEGKFDEETVKSYATESGLAAIAAKEGSSVVFVNPIGDEWSDADAEFANAYAGAISNDSVSERANGITNAVNFMTKEAEQKITGTPERVYVYGIGKGADFALNNMVKDLTGSVTYPDGVTIEFNNTIAGATLNGLSNVSTVEKTDIPVVSIGNSSEVNSLLSENAGSLTETEEADYMKTYDEVTSNYRRQAGVLVPVHKWDKEGIVEKIETFDVQTSPDNVTFQGQETHPINYVTYYDEALDVENGNVPLVLCFHGGGNTALYEAQATEWPVIGQENGFITVSVDLHFPNCTATEIVDLIEYLKSEYSIDDSKIYASGFSMGGCKSWDLYEQYPNVFAGLAPMDATAEPGEDSFGNPATNPNTDTIVPIFYVGGEKSPLPELPRQEQKVVNRIANLFEVNQVEKPYDISFDEQDSWENPIWGVDGDATYEVPDEKAFLDSVLTVQTFNSVDGNCYTALAVASNQEHEVYARNSWAAWDFMSKFSRESDGSIKISE